MAEPKPLTPFEKRFSQAALVVGVIIVIVGFIYMDDLPGFAVGAVVGGGAALAATGFIRLFHPPDR